MARESHEAKTTRLRSEIATLRRKAHTVEEELEQIGNARGLPAAEAMRRAVLDLAQAQRRLR